MMESCLKSWTICPDPSSSQNALADGSKARGARALYNLVHVVVCGWKPLTAAVDQEDAVGSH